MGGFGAIFGSRSAKERQGERDEVEFLRHELAKQKENYDAVVASTGDAFRKGYEKARVEYVGLARKLEEENQRLQSYGTEIVTVRRNLGDSEISVSELTAKLEESERLRKEAAQEADQLRERVGKPDEVLKSKNSKIASLESANKRLKSEIATLTEEVAGVKKQLEAANATSKAAEKNSEGILATLTQILTQKQAIRITSGKPAKTLKAECSFTVSISTEPDWEAVLTRSAKHVGDAAAKAIIEKGKLLYSGTKQ